MRRSARVAIAAVTLAATAALSGCSALINPQQTADYRYNGGDGASVDVGGVSIRGLMVVGTEADAPGRLLYTAINTTEEAKTVTLEINGEEFTNELAAGEDLQQNSMENSQVLPEAGAPAGSLATFTVDVDGETADVDAQVIGPDQPDYRELVPTEQATPTSTGEPAEDATPAETGTAGE